MNDDSSAINGPVHETRIGGRCGGDSRGGNATKPGNLSHKGEGRGGEVYIFLGVDKFGGGW